MSGAGAGAGAGAGHKKKHRSKKIGTKLTKTCLKPFASGAAGIEEMQSHLDSKKVSGRRGACSVTMVAVVCRTGCG